jgi:hypothetical protein
VLTTVIKLLAKNPTSYYTPFKISLHGYSRKNKKPLLLHTPHEPCRSTLAAGKYKNKKMSNSIFPQEKSNPVSIRTAAHEHFLPFPGQTLRVSPIKKQATTDYQGLDEKQPRKINAKLRLFFLHPGKYMLTFQENMREKNPSLSDL